MSLKAAAAKVLERSCSRNWNATSPETPRNSGAISGHQKVAPAQHIATAEIERRIRAMAARWDYAPDELAEAFASAQRLVEHDEATAVPVVPDSQDAKRVQCGTCRHWCEYRPHLGHCAKGHHHAIAGNWATTWCECADYAGGD